jgi:hypothetical protein
MWAFCFDFVRYVSPFDFSFTARDWTSALEKIDTALKMMYTNPHCFDSTIFDKIVFCAHCARSIDDEGR